MSTSRTEELATEFERHRGHLVGVAYRITGTLADAEDAVQEAWMRLSRIDVAELRDVRAWLTTVVGRIGLDRLRSAAARRERYVGPWLPEPILTTPDAEDPLAQVVQDDDVRMAALVVLERLTPEQRVAFVLHDAFGVPFAEIASVLGCSAVAARQHASRGRRAVADAEPPPRASVGEQQRLLDEFAAAVTSGDLEAIVRLLHPDVVMIGDGGGQAPAAGRPLHGPQEVANFMLGLARIYAVGAQVFEPVLVNGDLGWLVRAQRTVSGRMLPAGVAVIAVRGGRIVGLYNVVNPEKLSRLPAPRPAAEPPEPRSSS
ncbi:MAG TPA: sigma-70 family RNA polymerase sigma factor [Pseudonocardiaceae bacterium]